MIPVSPSSLPPSNQPSPHPHIFPGPLQSSLRYSVPPSLFSSQGTRLSPNLLRTRVLQNALGKFVHGINRKSSHSPKCSLHVLSLCASVKPLILQFYSIFQLDEYRCRAISFQGSFPNFLVLSGLRQVRSLWLLFASVPP